MLHYHVKRWLNWAVLAQGSFATSHFEVHASYQGKRQLLLGCLSLVADFLRVDVTISDPSAVR